MCPLGEFVRAVWFHPRAISIVEIICKLYVIQAEISTLFNLPVCIWRAWRSVCGKHLKEMRKKLHGLLLSIFQDIIHSLHYVIWSLRCLISPVTRLFVHPPLKPVAAKSNYSALLSNRSGQLISRAKYRSRFGRLICLYISKAIWLALFL